MFLSYVDYMKQHRRRIFIFIKDDGKKMMRIKLINCKLNFMSVLSAAKAWAGINNQPTCMGGVANKSLLFGGGT